ncbi:MAG TPA: hypothetical protein VGP78_03750 [Solirubrobacteraceae bacterium]|nr:hypothetical protein [Solirubrobacteraceae bacterium]
MTGPARSRTSSPRPLSRAERAAARVVTGPAGHLAAGVTDWAVLFTRYAWARVRARRPGREAP